MDPWVGKTPWTRKWQPTPGLLPVKFHGQRSLAGYHSRVRKKSDMTEPMSTNTHPSLIGSMCGWGSPRHRQKPQAQLRGRGQPSQGWSCDPCPIQSERASKGPFLAEGSQEDFHCLLLCEPWELLSTGVLPWIRIKTEVTLRDVNIETDSNHFVGALYKAAPEHRAHPKARAQSLLASANWAVFSTRCINSSISFQHVDVGSYIIKVNLPSSLIISLGYFPRLETIKPYALFSRLLYTYCQTALQKCWTIYSLTQCASDFLTT